MSLHTRQTVADHWIKPLREGKPELGWPGDPDLVLAYANIESRWELWRHEPVRGNPDRHVLVASGPPGAEINESAINSLIRHLVAHDTHRPGNSAEAQLERVLRHNDKVERENTQRAVEATSDALSKFYHEAGKTLGVTKTFFPT